MKGSNLVQVFRSLTTIALAYASLGLACGCQSSEGKTPGPKERPSALPSAQSVAAPPAAAPTTVPDHIIPYREEVMGTVVDLTLWTNDEVEAAKAAEAVFLEFKRVDKLMSSWLDTSTVAQINQNAGLAAVVVDDEFMMLASRAQEAAKQSGGAFDITVGAFRGLWKFDQDLDGSIPSAADVKQRTKLVGYKGVQLNAKKRSIRLARKGMLITLGGIAKGYALDQAVAILRARGHQHFILQAGGDLYAAGQRGERPWRVGVRDPRGDKGASFAMAEISDATFSTSGDYERAVVVDGVRYHHLLDPSTGAPAMRSRSVTVKAPDALTADIWSTALFILGHEKGMKIVEARPDLEAIFVDADNKLHISSGLKDTLQIIKPPTPGI